MKTKSLEFTLTCLLLSCFAVPVLACCPPPQPPCYRCEGGVWVWNCSTGQICCNGTCCSPNKCCNGVCCSAGQNCCNGTCCSNVCCNGVCCAAGQICCGGMCSSGCWKWHSIPPLLETCPPCEYLGCPGTVQIRSSYEEWVTSSDYGWCKNPTKTEIVGYLYDCKEDWDFEAMLECAMKGYVCHEICVAAALLRSPLLISACVLCLTMEAICASHGLCTFVEGCIPGEPALSPIERTVVDFGADWGEYRKCD